MKDKPDIVNQIKVIYNQMGKIADNFSKSYYELNGWAKALEWVLK